MLALSLSLYDLYLAAVILGGGYVMLSAVMGHLHFGYGDHGGDLASDSGDVGHDAGGHDGAAGHHDLAQQTHGVLDVTEDQRPVFSATSPTTIASFLAGFGGAGLVTAEGYGWPQTYALPVAMLSGLLVAKLIMGVFNTLGRAATGSSHARIGELIGTIAQVITPISGGEPGEISYVLHGSRYSRSARSADGQSIERGTRVTIEALDGSETFVLPETDK
ncbi:MAG: hypothetical protein HJJLKODD_00758 [Phycisphaerae bacterium]|nr:hypothetical protein [Phycisphaerae bacterium]